MFKGNPNVFMAILAALLLYVCFVLTQMSQELTAARRQLAELSDMRAEIAQIELNTRR